MRRKARSLAQSQGLYTVRNPQRDYYREQYNTATQDYTKVYKAQPELDEEDTQKIERVSDMLRESGYWPDLSLHPEQFEKENSYLNEYHELASFLPESLAKTAAAKSKAKAEAKKALPASASDG